MTDCARYQSIWGRASSSNGGGGAQTTTQPLTAIARLEHPIDSYRENGRAEKWAVSEYRIVNMVELNCNITTRWVDAMEFLSEPQQSIPNRRRRYLLFYRVRYEWIFYRAEKGGVCQTPSGAIISPSGERIWGYSESSSSSSEHRIPHPKQDQPQRAYWRLDDSPPSFLNMFSDWWGIFIYLFRFNSAGWMPDGATNYTINGRLGCGDCKMDSPPSIVKRVKWTPYWYSVCDLNEPVKPRRGKKYRDRIGVVHFWPLWVSLLSGGQKTCTRAKNRIEPKWGSRNKPTTTVDNEL